MFSCMVYHQKKKEKEKENEKRKKSKILLELSVLPVLVFVVCYYCVKFLSFT